MIWLLRGFAIIGLWLFNRRRRTTSPEIALRIEKLSWAQKGQLVWRIVQDQRVPLATRAIVLLPGAYLISPIDLLPDFIPFLGRMDDATVFAVAVDLLARFMPAWLLEEHVAAVAGRGRRGHAAPRNISLGPTGGAAQT
jgi:uncharacterized membrane protein YkvA (DUF1232 family)